MELREKCLLSPISCAREHAPSLGQRDGASHFSSLSKLGKWEQLAGAAGWRAGVACPARSGRGCLSSVLCRAQTPSTVTKRKKQMLPGMQSHVSSFLHSCIDEMKGAAQTTPKGSSSIAYS